MTALVPALLVGLGAGGLAARSAEESAWPIAVAQATPMQVPGNEQVFSDFSMLSAGIALYKLDHGQAPPNLEALLKDLEGQPYIWMDALPLDPWGYGYHYSGPTEESSDWQLSSWGSDGLQGGDGEAADTHNHLLKSGGR